jgi:hypothetical protein
VATTRAHPTVRFGNGRGPATTSRTSSSLERAMAVNLEDGSTKVRIPRGPGKSPRPTPTLRPAPPAPPVLRLLEISHLALAVPAPVVRCGGGRAAGVLADSLFMPPIMDAVEGPSRHRRQMCSHD